MKTQCTFALKLFALSFTSFIATALAPISATWAHSQPPYSTVRVSVSSKGVQGNGNSYDAQISANGRFVVFRSSASNLVAGDHNGVDDVFVHDLKTRRTKRVSVSSAGIEGNGKSRTSHISANGRYVSFVSDANNLVTGDDNGVTDIFVRDLKTGITRRVFLDDVVENEYDGTNLFRSITITSLSYDGRFLAIQASSIFPEVFVNDLKTGVTQSMKINDGVTAFHAGGALSANGRFVAFASYGGACDGIIRDYILYLHDHKTGERQCVDSNDIDGGFIAPALSPDARFVAYDAEQAGVFQILVRRISSDIPPQLVSLNIAGLAGNSHSWVPKFSANSQIVFESLASDLVARDNNSASDIFIRDIKAGLTRRASVNSTGKEGNKGSYGASISATGDLVAFESDSSNLVKGDTNGKRDAFVHLWR